MRIRHLALLLLSASLPAADGSHAAWQDYGGAPDAAQYSSLEQIDRANVDKLQIAWTYPTGDDAHYAFNPLMANGLLYVLARNNSIVALEAASGKQVWVHATDAHTRLITNRGINYWQSKDGRDRRLLFACNNQLEAIDARTGLPIASFGSGGRVDLRFGLGRDPKSLALVQSTTPGKVFEDLLILGSATNQGYGSAPGDIRAFDVRTGKQVWTFHTIPHPGEFGYETWPEGDWKTAGGANAWSELSLDEERGIVYVPTASPKYNFYGADRHGANLFGDCLLALDARSGKRLWHFQMVHHDIWDYDNGTAPKLLSVMHDGKPVDVVAQVGKEGFVWVFNRVTGAPLWPVAERPVAQTDMPGEETWPTQPFPAAPPPFARQSFRVEDLSPFLTDPQERAHWVEKIQEARNQGLFTPPGLHGTIEMPGNNGGANWGGAAVDPRRGTLYVVSKDLPALLKLERNDPQALAPGSTPEQKGAVIYQANCRGCHGGNFDGQPPIVPSLVHIGERIAPARFKDTVWQGAGSMPAFPALSSEELDELLGYLAHPVSPVPSTAVSATGAPVRYFSSFGFMITKAGVSPIKPPWTSLTAYDLNRGTIQWRVPLGEVPELAAQGAAHTGVHFPKIGPVVTAGGLIFTASRDRFVRAVDEESGRVLWETKLDAGLEGIPAVYSVGGREYLVVCAAAPAGTEKVRGSYVAFALPAQP